MRDLHHHDPRALGCLGMIWLVLLALILSGLLQGWGMAAGILGVILLLPMIWLAYRAERSRSKRLAASHRYKLPQDANLSIEERREALRRYEEDDEARRD